MSIRRGRVPGGLMSLAGVAVVLALSLSAQASGPDTELVPSTSLEALPMFAADQEPSISEPGVLAGKLPKGSVRGSRVGKTFTPAGKKELDAANAAKNDGVNKCENCGVEVMPGQKSQRGVPPPANQRERDHVIPKSKGGDGTPANGQILFRECNLDKADKTP